MLAELRGTAGGKKGETFRQIETIIANMERWRWYSRDLGSAHVIVNQPDFTLLPRPPSKIVPQHIATFRC
jgi:hypothetical protein